MSRIWDIPRNLRDFDIFLLNLKHQMTSVAQNVRMFLVESLTLAGDDENDGHLFESLRFLNGRVYASKSKFNFVMELTEELPI